jgi:hypothetical protein
MKLRIGVHGGVHDQARVVVVACQQARRVVVVMGGSGWGLVSEAGRRGAGGHPMCARWILLSTQHHAMTEAACTINPGQQGQQQGQQPQSPT